MSTPSPATHYKVRRPVVYRYCVRYSAGNGVGGSNRFARWDETCAYAKYALSLGFKSVTIEVIE